MIYFDNAATTKYKNDGVLKAFVDYVTEIGVSPSRGTYPLAVTASRILYQTRKNITEYFGGTNSDYVCFTKNSTEAINFFVRGVLKKGDHVLISPYEHNAVLRPIHKLMLEGEITYDVLPEDVIYDNQNKIADYIKDSTKVVFLTLASNLTGQIVFNSVLSSLIHELGIKVFLDSSQGAGKIDINMVRDHIDFLAFTGHKDIMALPGIGGLCYIDELKIDPLVQGGTGIHGHEFINPQIYPDAYEAGTLNMPAIAALNEAIIELKTSRNMRNVAEQKLIKYLISELTHIDNVIIYNKDRDRVGTIAFNLKGKTSDEVVSILNSKDICVRGGIHCAILAHRTLGTVETGAVRISLNYQNTIEEIDEFVKVIKDIA